MLKLIYESENGKSITFTVPDQGETPTYLLVGVEGIHGLASNIFDYSQYMQHGTTYVGSQLYARDIRIVGRVMGEVVPNRINLLEAMNPLYKGTLTLRRDGFVRKIGCVIEKAPAFPAQNGWQFTVDLRCPSPFWETTEQTRTEIAYWEPMFEWELDIPIDDGVIFGTRTVRSLINVYNESDLDIGFVIVMRAIGTAVNPTLIHAQDTSTFIRALLTMNPGDRIEISTVSRNMYARITRDGVTSNIFGHIDPHSVLNWTLRRGDNLMRFEADEGGTLVDVDIYYMRQYMGV